MVCIIKIGEVEILVACTCIVFLSQSTMLAAGFDDDGDENQD
jgi:hypothetical protein